MEVSAMIKSAWMNGWSCANTGYTDFTKESAWTSSVTYRQYKKVLAQEKSLKGDKL